MAEIMYPQSAKFAIYRQYRKWRPAACVGLLMIINVKRGRNRWMPAHGNNVIDMAV
jgi:hypothetical protein